MPSSTDLLRVTNAIAEYLDGWTVEPDERDCTLTDGKHRIGVHWAYRNEGRIAVAPELGRDWMKYRPSFSRPEITVDSTRHPETLAKDLLRRVIPQGCEWIDELEANRRRHSDAHDARLATARELAALYQGATVDDRPDNNRTSVRLPYLSDKLNGSIEVGHHADLVTIELRNCPLDLARRIIPLLSNGS